MKQFLPLAPILLLAACGGSDGADRPVPTVGAPTPRPVRHAPLETAGLGSVLGADADSLVRQFGTPRLDIREGDGRKLQWQGAACILDAYLYPADRGRTPVATYLDARRGDGRDVDRAACVAALRKP